MTTIMRREGRALPDLFDWLETELPALPMFRSFTPTQLMRVEELLEEKSYTLRLEVPGIDPEKDITVAIEEGVLTVTAVRKLHKEEPTRSEFRYGTLTRAVTLPLGADPEDVKATYREGILEVRVGIKPEIRPPVHRIPITKS